MKIAAFILTCLLSALPLVGHSQIAMPTSVEKDSIPDDWLVGNGWPWFYKSTVSYINPVQISYKKDLSPAEQKIVSKAESMFNRNSTKAMVLVDDGKIIFEKFVSPVNKDVRLMSFSMQKTITAMAVGKAICENKLKMSDTVGEIIPELKDKDISVVTVKELLTMTSGSYSEGDFDKNSFGSNEQLAQLRKGEISYLDLIKSSPAGSFQKTSFGRTRKPGEVFSYHGTDPILAGIMVGRATGGTYAQYVTDNILTPAGITSYAVLGVDHFGYAMAHGSLRMKLDDWVKLAVWIKNSESSNDCFGNFVKEATSKQVSNNSDVAPDYYGYGYFTWTNNKYASSTFWALGYGGQNIAWSKTNSKIMLLFSTKDNYNRESAEFFNTYNKM
jgi:CubicO group peptidase (beta-lactamase class C family)